MIHRGPSSVPVRPLLKIYTFHQGICIGNRLENTVLGLRLAARLAPEDTRAYCYRMLMLEIPAEAPSEVRNRKFLVRYLTKMQIFKEYDNK